MVMIARLLVVGLWVCTILFAVVIFRRPAGANEADEKGHRPDRLGIILQTLSFPCPWTFRRLRVNPFGGESLVPDIFIALASLLIAIGSLALVSRAKNRLGKHWALSARVVAGHHLVTDGPFGRVRHPLYLSMGILLLAAVIGLASPIGAALTAGLFGWGTALRVRAEDRLLAETFGREFEEYRRRVPGFFPRFKHMD